MRILVCFKVSHDLETLTDEEWKQMADEGVDFSYIKSQLNCFDEAALELGLRLKEQIGPEAELEAITVSSSLNSNYEKNLFAVGYDKLWLMETDEDLTYSPKRTAQLIKEFTDSQEKYDLVIMGEKSAEGANEQTHYMYSSFESIKNYTHVNYASYCNGKMLVCNQDENFMYTREINERCVLGVENAKHPYLRIATLREKMQVKGKKAQTIKPKCSQNNISAKRLEKELSSRKCVMANGETLSEKVDDIMAKYLTPMTDGDKKI